MFLRILCSGTVSRYKPKLCSGTVSRYPNTTGLDCIDYRFTDAICDHPESTQEYSEKLVRLPTFFNSLSKQELLNVPVGPAPPMLAKGHVTFGRHGPCACIQRKSD
jgi:protein O-GlcNAc transferase